VHRSPDLELGRVRVWYGIACSDPLPAVVDLGALLPAGALDETVNAELASRLVTVTPSRPDWPACPGLAAVG
jgi:hypothetical protein